MQGLDLTHFRYLGGFWTNSRHLGFWNSTDEWRSENKWATCVDGHERKRQFDISEMGSTFETLNTKAAFGKLSFKGLPWMASVYLHQKNNRLWPMGTIWPLDPKSIYLNLMLSCNSFIYLFLKTSSDATFGFPSHQQDTDLHPSKLILFCWENTLSFWQQLSV